MYHVSKFTFFSQYIYLTFVHYGKQLFQVSQIIIDDLAESHLNLELLTFKYKL